MVRIHSKSSGPPELNSHAVLKPARGSAAVLAVALSRSVTAGLNPWQRRHSQRRCSGGRSCVPGRPPLLESLLIQSALRQRLAAV